MAGRPSANEYASYYETYIALVPEGEILAVLEAQARQVQAFAARVPLARETFRYTPGKWSVREVMGHLADGERVFGYRATCIARGDETPLPRFDENLYVANAGFDRESLASLAGEFLHLRAANLAALQRLDHDAWLRIGTASEKSISVRALAYIMAGHVRHHLEILQERYGVGL